MPAGSWQLHCDGTALPNPGRMAVGVVLRTPDGNRQELSQTLPGTGCNNEAELRALILALHTAETQGAQTLCLYSDSRVVLDELRGLTPRPIARLAPLFDEARSLLARFAHCELHWLPAHRNTEADALARRALGLAGRMVQKPRRRQGLSGKSC